MDCPYCGKPMEAGNIPGRRDSGVYWVPEGEDVSVAFSNWVLKEKDGIQLCDPKLIGIPELKTYVCRACKKGIFDLPQRGE